MFKKKKKEENTEETQQQAQLPEAMQKAIDESKVDRVAEYKEYQKQMQRALYYFTNENIFIGNLLQEFSFKPEYRIPTACISYDKKRQHFEIFINPNFFLSMPMDQQIGVLHHEILHFVNNHIFRFSAEKSSSEDKSRDNVALDMSINQYIKALPKGCVDVKYYKEDNGTPFPIFQPAETYQKLLKDNPDAQKNARQAMKDDGIDLGEDKGHGEGVMDSHDWEALSEEEKKQMANEIKKLVKRTMEKTSYDKSALSDSMKEFIEEIEAFLSKMNYKRILQETIKKTVCFADRASTWRRPNKRYGTVAPGTTISKLPQLNTYIDTSGSISVKEANQFLAVLNGFLKVGVRNCILGLWHTSLYRRKKYKLNQKLYQNEIESGGTDMTEVCEDINLSKPDLAIILTDGYYDTRVVPEGEVVIIISEGGNMDHPLKGKQNIKTIPMKGLNN